MTTPNTVAPQLEVTIGGANPGSAGLTTGVYSANVAGAPVISSTTTTVEITPAVDVPETTVYKLLVPDVTTQSRAVSVINEVDGQINYISGVSATIGATLNRFSGVMDFLGSTRSGMEVSRSRIMDADFAEETSHLTASKIISQSSLALLAQANSQAKMVLQLLTP